MSIFFIVSIAAMALRARTGSGSAMSSPRMVGLTCQDRPNRSLSHPHCASSPPAVSLDQT
jgi:hypothetical protein